LERPIVIGVVIVTHCRLGEELLNAAKFILGETERCGTVAVDMESSPEALQTLVEEAIKSQNAGQGVLVMTDMFGGTPSNISLSFLKEGEVEVLTGASLPMLLRAFQQRHKPEMTLAELAVDVLEYTRKAVALASQFLKKSQK
jgi:PTS system mannose-specific IIA component